jgi:hypothetical protein
MLSVAIAALVLVVASAQRPIGTDDAGNVPAPSKDEQIAALDRQLFERDNEILHLRTEWATCRASLDATELSAQATELVRRCEIATGGKCEWDNGARKVIIIGSKESK